MGEETSINTSTIKGFIFESDLRASRDGIDALRKELHRYARLIVANAKDVAIEKKKKTISGEHITEALKNMTATNNGDEETGEESSDDTQK